MNLPFDTVEDYIRNYDLPPEVTVAEFGLYKGNTIYRILDEVQKKGSVVKSVYTFDSFVGLPEEQKGIRRSPDWAPGNFSSVEEFGTEDIDEIIEIIQKKVRTVYPPGLTVIPGWFAGTLNKNTIDQYGIRDINLAHIDTDLYISTAQALSFLFENDLLADNAIIRFDDFISDVPFGLGGQTLSWVRAEQKYKIRSTRLSYNVYSIHK